MIAAHPFWPARHTLHGLVIFSESCWGGWSARLACTRLLVARTVTKQHDKMSRYKYNELVGQISHAVTKQIPVFSHPSTTRYDFSDVTIYLFLLRQQCCKGEILSYILNLRLKQCRNNSFKTIIYTNKSCLWFIIIIIFNTL